jgi:hypothetical protein
VIKITNNIFFKAEERDKKKRGEKNTLLELHHAWDKGMRLTTMKGVARRIQCHPDMRCSSNGRHRMRHPKGANASHMLARVMHTPIISSFSF